MAGPTYPSYGYVATASSVPSRTGSVPKLFSATTLRHMYESSLVPRITNTNSTNELKMHGDNLTFRRDPQVTVSTYVVGGGYRVQRFVPDTVTLVVDKAKAFAVQEYDVDRQQSDIDWFGKVKELSANAIDESLTTELLSALPAFADSANMGANAGILSGNINLGEAGSPVEITKTTASDTLLSCTQALDEQKVPQDGRFVVVDAGFWKRLMGDLKDAAAMGDTVSTLRTGKVGTIDGLTVIKSTLLPYQTDSGETCCTALFGRAEATVFASTINNVKQVTPTDEFAEIIRGLNVYGYKVVYPNMLGALYYTNTSD